MTDLQRIYDELLTPEAKIALLLRFWLEQQLSTTAAPASQGWTNAAGKPSVAVLGELAIRLRGNFGNIMSPADNTLNEIVLDLVVHLQQEEQKRFLIPPREEG